MYCQDLSKIASSGHTAPKHSIVGRIAENEFVPFRGNTQATQIYEWPYKGQNLWCVGTLHFLGVLWLGLKEPRFTENSVDQIACIDCWRNKLLNHRVDWPTLSWSKIVHNHTNPFDQNHAFGQSPWWFSNTMAKITFDTYELMHFGQQSKWLWSTYLSVKLGSYDWSFKIETCFKR